MPLLDCVLGSLVGLAGHQSEAMLLRWESNGTPKAWILLARYTIGVMIALPVFLLLRGRIDEGEVKDFVLSFVFVGAGVVAGHVLDER